MAKITNCTWACHDRLRNDRDKTTTVCSACRGTDAWVKTCARCIPMLHSHEEDT
jgi:hypothetical protein